MVDIDVEKVCRVCLQSDLKLSLLFDEQNAVGGVGLSDMISECTVYTVWRYDGFPELICNSCKENVRTSYAFKKQFEASHRKLLSLLEMKLVLPEPPSDPNDKCTQTDDSSLYPCEKCDEKFITYERLRDHRLSVHRGTANACRLCPKSFNRISDLKNHIAVYHPESGFTPNECGICKKKFIRKDHVTRHLRKVHKIGAEKNVSSERLGNNALYPNELEMTEAQNSKGGTPIDPMESFEIRSGVNETVRSGMQRGHLPHGPNLEIRSGYGPANGNKNEAVRSGLVGKNSIRRGEHRKSFLGATDQIDVENKVDLVDIKEEPNDMQTESNSKSPSAEQLKEINRPHQCGQCDKVYFRMSHLNRHVLSHSKLKSFTCQFCKKQFHRSDHLKKHYRSKHKLGLQPKESSTRDDDITKETEPEIIEGTESDTLNQVDGFEITIYENDVAATNPMEMEAENSMDATTQMEAESSMEIEEQKPDLESLLVYDSADGEESGGCSEKPSSPKFKCSQCDRVYVRSTHLRRHMLSHSKEKPYSCHLCEKRYHRSDHLKNHITKHRSDEP